MVAAYLSRLLNIGALVLSATPTSGLVDYPGQGYHATIPQGWVIATQKGSATTSESSTRPEELAAAPPRCDLAAHDPRNGDGRPSITILLAESPGPLTDGTRERLLSQLKDDLGSYGPDAGKIRSEEIRIDGRPALRVEYSAMQSSFWTVLLPTGQRMLMITCTDHRDRFKQSQRVFEKFLRDLRITDAPARVGSKQISRAALVGMLLAAAFVMYRVRKRARTTRSE